MSVWAGPTPPGRRFWPPSRTPSAWTSSKSSPGDGHCHRRQGVYLSGGEQQRLAIARAFLKNAPILILDEATAFADPDNESKVQAAFLRLAKGKTVIMIAHRLSTVVNADCVYVLDKGQIVESGNPNTLIQRQGLFARMWNNYQTSAQWKVAKEG